MYPYKDLGSRNSLLKEEWAGVRSSRGSPDACRLFEGQGMVEWAVATAGRKLEEQNRK